jgi:hypothetical protein
MGQQVDYEDNSGLLKGVVQILWKRGIHGYALSIMRVPKAVRLDLVGVGGAPTASSVRLTLEQAEQNDRLEMIKKNNGSGKGPI